MARKKSSLVEEPLTERELTMVDAQLRGESLNAALKEAGYKSNKTAIAQTDRIKTALAEARSTISNATTLTRLDVLDGFLESIDMAKTMAEPSTMIAGWDKVAKMMGFYEPQVIKHEVSVNGQVMVKKMESMSDEELLALIEQHRTPAIEGECRRAD